MPKRGSLKNMKVLRMGFGREDMQNKKRNYGKQKRKPFLKDFLFVRCLAESNRSTRFCRPLPNRSVKTPCSVATSFLISECKGTAFILFYQIFSCFFLIILTFIIKSTACAVKILAFSGGTDSPIDTNGGIRDACRQCDTYNQVLDSHSFDVIILLRCSHWWSCCA